MNRPYTEVNRSVDGRSIVTVLCPIKRLDLDQENGRSAPLFRYDDLTIKGEDEANDGPDIHPLAMFKSCLTVLVGITLCALFFYGAWEVLVLLTKNVNLPDWAFNGMDVAGLK